MVEIVSVLDVETIQNLKTLQEKTGKNLLAILSKLYIETTPQIISKMKSLLTDKSYEDLSREAHSLKSSSANLGASKMAELCKKVEYGIVGDDDCSDHELEILIEQIVQSFPEVLEELEKIA